MNHPVRERGRSRGQIVLPAHRRSDMGEARALVITGYGTNCERETAHAARVAGAAVADIAHFADLVADRVRLDAYNFLLFPGGFLDADDLGAAQAAALRWKHAVTHSGRKLLDDLLAFLDRGALVLGICNGFQLLVKLGLLPSLDNQRLNRTCSLSTNDSARFEDRWVHIAVNPSSPCVFTRGLDRLFLPVRHGEGKLIPMDNALLERLESEDLIALRYTHPSTGEPTMEYPYNPNGSPRAIAGLTDPTGRILGLMPHPEAYNHPTNNPCWTRGTHDPLGIVLLQNGVTYLEHAHR